MGGVSVGRLEGGEDLAVVASVPGGVGSDPPSLICPVLLEAVPVLENFLDDLRIGGLGGGGESRDFFVLMWALTLPPRSPAFTVDPEEDEVKDSRSAGRPWLSNLPLPSPWTNPPTFRPVSVTGGQLRVGLSCLGLATGFETKRNAGEWEDIDVGVEVRLNGPGDSEQRVEGLLGHPATSGVKTGKF